MSTSNQNPPESSDEQRFIQRAMADIDKAEKIQKIKQIAVKGILLAVLLWMVIREPGPNITNAMLFMGIAIGIVKILFQIDNNTRKILRALGNRR